MGLLFVFGLSAQSNAQLPHTTHRLHRDEIGLAVLVARLSMKL
jgi:hypothetical protein